MHTIFNLQDSFHIVEAENSRKVQVTNLESWRHLCHLEKPIQFMYLAFYGLGPSTNYLLLTRKLNPIWHPSLALAFVFSQQRRAPRWRASNPDSSRPPNSSSGCPFIPAPNVTVPCQKYMKTFRSLTTTQNRWPSAPTMPLDSVDSFCAEETGL